MIDERAIVLIGAGGHAKVLLDALARAGRRIAGITDVDPKMHGITVGGSTVLGDDSVLSRFPAANTLLAIAVGSVDASTSRQRIYERLRGQGYRFLTVVHPAAIVAGDVAIADGAQVMAGVILQPGASLGENVLVNTGAQVDHDCVVGRHTHIAPGVTLSGDVRVGEGSHIGAGATVIQGIRIGAGCLVAAGSVVVRDVPDGHRVAGVPARRLGS